MRQVTIHEAKTHLSRLIQAALNGEEIIIAKGKKPLVRLGVLAEARRQRQVGGQPGLVVSKASLWEITIKVGLGKLVLSGDWFTVVENEMQSNGIQWLEVDVDHCKILAELPYHHRDPFDRLLISQATGESMAVVSIDGQFSRYPLDMVW